MTDPTQSLCEQKKQTLISQLYYTPLPRYTPVNPYAGGIFTKFQLDMRRKAEVLKYSANKSSTQTNNLSKAQKFALLVRGSLPAPTQAALQKASENGGVIDCSNDELILTPTTASNIPGPIVYLYNDETVPLYNYSDYNTRSYPVYVPDNPNMWKFVPFSDIVINNDSPSDVYYLILNRAVDQPQYIYNFVTPLELNFSGTVPAVNSPPLYSKTNIITISVKTAKLSAYFNGNLVRSIDASGSALSAIKFDLSTSATGSFSSKQFLGNLYFNGLLLDTSPTYVYTFSVFVTLSITSDNSSDPGAENFKTKTVFKYNVVSNTTISANTYANCVIKDGGGKDPLLNKGPSLVGIM
jgi:hypothetical protein